MRKSSLALVLCLLLTIGLSVGGTIAYMTDTASTVNTFTVGNVDIELNEEYEQNTPLMPGAEVEKTANIKNIGNNDAYVMMTVAVPTITGADGESQPVVTPVFEETGWTVKEDGVTNPILIDGENYHLYVYMYDEILKANASTNDLLTGITLDKRVDYDPNTGKYVLVENGTENEITANLTAGKVYVNAFAIQAVGFEDAEDPAAAAYNAFAEQWLVDGQWSNKQILTGTENGVVGTAEDFIAVLKEAEADANGDVKITLANDFDMTGYDASSYVNGYNGAGVITIEGDGHKLTNLSVPLFKGGFAGNSGIVINNLTIADSDIKSTNDLGSGAFVEAIDSMPTITLKNCKLVNSTVTGSRTGGIIGWNAGYNNVNDGPVKTYVTIENCSVEGCTITGDGSVGGIIGHAGNNAWTWNTITGCTVTNTKLISNDDSYRVGGIVGTANVGEVVINSCSIDTFTDENMVQNNNGTVIARPAGQSNLYGRFVPNDTGKLTIDGTAIQ